jgi:hypothetical protein
MSSREKVGRLYLPPLMMLLKIERDGEEVTDQTQGGQATSFTDLLLPA